MTNNIQHSLLTVLFLALLCLTARANTLPPYIHTKLLPEIKSVKTGVLFGLQKGEFTAFEIGMERQWKKVKLLAKDYEIKAINFVMEYQFRSNVFGLKPGFWFKTGRLSFTYGGALTLLTDFKYNRVGISPQLGYRFLNFHGLASYNLVVGPKEFIDYNRIHVAIRFYLNQSRKIEVEKKDGKKKTEKTPENKMKKFGLF
jgi:hypothetical protein